jgi:hypothetical protein
VTATDLELLEPDAQGETEEDLGVSDVSRAVVTATDWTTETILSQLRRGNIELNPRFQRRDAWGDDRKSRFIESLFLGMPTPQLVLAERRGSRGSFLVIDGKQRLLTLRRFAARDDDEFEPLPLHGLDIRSDLNGETLLSLQDDDDRTDDLNEFDNQTIRTVVVRNWPDEDFLYHVFLRLNTGSLPLSPQELRQALHPGPFVDFADDRSEESIPLREALGIDRPDFRMRDVELMIRFIGFALFLVDYRGNLKVFLDETCERLNSEWPMREGEVNGLADALDQAITTTREIFGENAFRRFAVDRFEGRFNRAVFDIMAYYFRHEEIAANARSQAQPVIAAFKDLSVNNLEFAEAVQSTTKSVKATHDRLAIWGGSLADALGAATPVPVPHLDENGHIVP